MCVHACSHHVRLLACVHDAAPPPLIVLTFHTPALLACVCAAVCGSEGGVSRVIVFASRRDSVGKINECLGQHKPTIISRIFIGQSGRARGSAGGAGGGRGRGRGQKAAEGAGGRGRGGAAQGKVCRGRGEGGRGGG